jgi:superfamily II DNA or RNA helicase
MHCRIAHKLFLTDIPEAVKDQIMAELTLENPKWLENLKMGRTNYKVSRHLKFYSTRTNGGLILPRGYGGRLARICAEQGEPVEYEDDRRSLPEVDFTFRGELRPYQNTACQAMLRKRFGTLCAPTGAGKTVCGLSLIAQRRQPALIVVHTRDLAMQWVERIEQFLDIPARKVGMIGSGKSTVGEAVTVATVQSVYSRAKDLKKRVGHIIVDECHRAPSRTFTAAVTAFDCAYSLGLSATPYRRDGLTQLIFWHLGEMHARIDGEDLMESGAILRPEICIRPTSFKCERDPTEEYGLIIADLTENMERNSLIVDEVAREVASGRGVGLVLSDRKIHCRMLQELLEERHGISGAILTGDTPLPERKRLVEQIQSGRVDVVFATGQLIGEGFDASNLTSLFLATPIKFSGRLIQYLGRVLRPAQGKAQPRVYDFVDEKVGVLDAAARARAVVYAGIFSPDADRQ